MDLPATLRALADLIATLPEGYTIRDMRISPGSVFLNARTPEGYRSGLGETPEMAMADLGAPKVAPPVTGSMTLHFSQSSQVLLHRVIPTLDFPVLFPEDMIPPDKHATIADALLTTAQTKHVHVVTQSTGLFHRCQKHVAERRFPGAAFTAIFYDDGGLPGPVRFDDAGRPTGGTLPSNLWQALQDDAPPVITTRHRR